MAERARHKVIAMITLKQIRHALAVEEHCHFKRAAEACAVSQAALSTSISEMEKQLGYSVFERDNKKVLITPLGQQMLDKVRSIFIEVNDLHRLGQTANKPLSSELSIGMIPTITLPCTHSFTYSSCAISTTLLVNRRRSIRTLGAKCRDRQT